MKYRTDKNNEPVSLLGYGCMRFDRKGSGIDLDKAKKELLFAIENGVNYFDTAYIYPGSEAALGEILKRTGMRDKVNIATKLPPYLVNSKADIEKKFTEQLQRLQTDHVDYYLMHMLTDLEGFKKLEEIGIREWIDEAKKSGKIRNVGFSFHGNSDIFISILEVFDWDFAQIQYNYVDEHTQAGRKGLEAAYAKGIPVIIMEPLRGGKLINMLPEEALKIMKESGRGWSPAEWGLRWLFNQPGVTCVLSGMNSLEMVEENCRIASEAEAGELTSEDFEVLNKVKEAINKDIKAPCTGCRYCMPCPMGVDIPGTFSCYNHVFTESKAMGRKEFWQTIALRKDSGIPSLCVQCGKCEAHCPQKLPIRKLLKEANKVVFPWYYRIAAAVSRRFLFKK